LKRSINAEKPTKGKKAMQGGGGPKRNASANRRKESWQGRC